MAEGEGGRGVEEVLTSIVGSGRGSLSCGSERVTLLGGVTLHLSYIAFELQLHLHLLQLHLHYTLHYIA